MHNAISIKQTVTKVIGALYDSGGFGKGGYYSKDSRSFFRDVEKSVNNYWSSSRTGDKCREELSLLVERVCIAFDRYALELYRLLLPHDLSRPQTSPLFRAAYQMINRYGKLGSFFSPEDALAATLEAIMFKNLAILQFKGESSLKTWVMSVLYNTIMQQARKEKITGGQHGVRILSLEEQTSHEGPSRLEALRSESYGQPEREQEHLEWLSARLGFLKELAAAGKEEQLRGDKRKPSPNLERAWILWNDYIADFFIEYSELVGREHEFSPPPFSLPPAEMAGPEKKGGHSPDYSNYLARGIGALRGLPSPKIEGDLSLPRTPRDESRLRAAVRARRNEGKMALAGDLLRAQGGKHNGRAS